MPTRIEHVCKCEHCHCRPTSAREGAQWFYCEHGLPEYGKKIWCQPYCPDCGWFLHKNGFAYEMVRAEKTPAQKWFDEHVEEASQSPDYWIECIELDLDRLRETLFDPADEGSDDDEPERHHS